MTNAIIQAITSVFTAVGDWIRSAITSMIPIFWTENQAGDGGSLTFMGVMALVSLGFAVIFLIIMVIQRFLKFQS